MIQISESGELLQVLASGDCDYATAREMLLTCKDRLKRNKLTQVDVVLEEVGVFHSCTIGALLILSDAVHGRLHVSLKHCSPEIHRLFESESIRQLFNFSPPSTPASSMFSACSHCFKQNCHTPGHDFALSCAVI